MTDSGTSIIIPAFNEAERIGASLDKLLRYADTHPNGLREIIVVDDGSTDGTASVVRNFQNRPIIHLVSYQPNGGKGYAVRRGVLEARGSQILISDADLSTPIEELGKLAQELEKADVVIGSRALDPSQVKEKQGALRQWMGKMFNRILRVATGLPYRDTQCGFKLFRRDPAREIFSMATVDRFAWDVEMLMIANRLGYSTAEVPVLWYNSPDSHVRIVRDSLRMFADVLAIRRRLGQFRPSGNRNSLSS